MQHHFDVKIAEEFGILEAVLLENISFWIMKNAANEKNCFEGDYWTYNSCRAFAELFPYATDRQIKYALNKLKDAGIIKVGNFNQNAYDRTLWYGLTEKGKCMVENRNFHLTKLSNGKDEIVKPIPYNKPNIKPDIKERKKEKTFDSIFESRKVDGELKEAFIELIKARKLNGKKMTNRALELAIEKVRRMADDEKTQIAIINQSIENGWQGLFPLKREEDTQSGERRYIEAAGEDISWRRTFNLWQKALGYKVPETVGNVEAAKKLLADEGEDGLNKLIGALAMRSKHGFLTREVKGVKDFETLLENKGAIRNFYNENCAKWERWAESAKSGKKRWEL